MMKNFLSLLATIYLFLAFAIIIGGIFLVAIRAAVQLEANYECAQYNSHGILTESGIYCYRIYDGTEWFKPLDEIRKQNQQPSDGLDT